MKFEWCLRGGAACVAALVVVNCFGKAIHSEDDPAAAAGGSGGSVDGGWTNTDSGGNGSTAESVVSTQSAQVTSSSSSTSSGSGGAGVTTGSGGSNGITGVGGIPGIGGFSSAAAVTGGDLPIPHICGTTRNEWLADDLYTFDVDCSGAPIAVVCHTPGDGTTNCSCQGDFQAGSFDFHGLNVEEAGSYAVAACLHASPFEAEPYECMRGYDVQDADECYSEVGCERDAVMGEMKLTESGLHTTRCSRGTEGWSCTCSAPVYGVEFLVPTLNSMTPCVEARDWCHGEELELSGKRDCTRTELSVTPDSCTAWMDCTRAVVASGMEATMFETKPLECWGGSDGRYECSCLSLLSQGSFYVDASDSAGACDAAVDICAGP